MAAGAAGEMAGAAGEMAAGAAGGDAAICAQEGWEEEGKEKREGKEGVRSAMLAPVVGAAPTGRG
jgi:hypothetical protein